MDGEGGMWPGIDRRPCRIRIVNVFIGGRAMFGRASTLFALKIAAGVGVLLFWPQAA